MGKDSKYYLQSYDYESITVSGSVVGLDSTKYDPDSDNGVAGNGAKEAELSVEVDSIRYTLSGLAPTSGDAIERNDGEHFMINGFTDIMNARFIKSDSAVDDPVIRVNYRR